MVLVNVHKVSYITRILKGQRRRRSELPEYFLVLFLVHSIEQTKLSNDASFEYASECVCESVQRWVCSMSVPYRIATTRARSALIKNYGNTQDP